MDQNEEFSQENPVLSEREGDSLVAMLKRYPGQAEELQGFLPAAFWLDARRSAVDPPQDSLRRGRERLLTQIESGVKPAAARARSVFRPSPAFRLAYRLALAFLLFACGFLAADGVVHASRTWLPGDPPYFIKTAQENLALRLSASSARRAALHIEYSRLRMLEAQALVLEGRYDRLPGTVVDFSEHVDLALGEIQRTAFADRKGGGQLAVQLQHALLAQHDLLAVLADASPPSARLEMQRLISISQSILVGLQELDSAMGG